jgi:hypothetical protein
LIRTHLTIVWILGGRTRTYVGLEPVEATIQHPLTRGASEDFLSEKQLPEFSNLGIALPGCRRRSPQGNPKDWCPWQMGEATIKQKTND